MPRTVADVLAGPAAAIKELLPVTACSPTSPEEAAALGALYEASLDAILLTAPDGQILRANPAACRLFGHSEERLRQIGRAGVVDASDPRLAPALAERARTGRFHGVLTYVRGDGTKFEAEVSTAVFRLPGGELGTSMVVRDVSERVQHELALQESEQLVRGTIDALSAHVCVLDEQGTILAVNRAWRGFATANQLRWQEAGEGANYLATCERATGGDAELATAFAAGIRTVMAGGQREFALEYPCHSPSVQRWFVGRVTRFAYLGGVRVVVAHEDITERKLAEETLRASEARYRAVVEDQTEVICRFLADGTLTFVNDIYCRIFGRTKDELLGHKWQPVAVVEDVPQIEERLRTMSPSNPIVVIENRVHVASGEVRWMQFVNRGFYDATEQLVEVQSVGRDITERKAANEALRRNEAYLSTLLDTLDDAVFTVQLPERRIVYANRALTRIVGYRPQDLIGRTTERLYRRHSDYDDYGRKLQEAFARGEARVQAELELWHDAGHLVWAEVNSSFLVENGRPSAVISVLRDITGRKQAEARIRQQLEEINSYYDNVPVGLAVLDADLRYLRINHKLAAINGVPAAEHIGKTVSEIVPTLAEQAEAVTEAIRRTGQPVTNIEFAGESAAQPGVIRTWLESWHPMKDATQGIVGFMVTVLEITERKRVEAALRESEARYRALYTAMDEAVALHEMLFDAAGNAVDFVVLGVNPAYEVNVGISADDIVGQKISKRFSPPPFLDRYANVVRTGEAVFFDAFFPPLQKHFSISAFSIGSPKFVTVFRDITERKQAEEELMRSREALRALAGRMEKVREEERSKVAREIHDVLAQELTRLKIDLVWLQGRLERKKPAPGAELAARVAEMTQMADTAVSTVQRIATELRPAVLDTFGLCAAVEWQTREFETRTGIACGLALPEEEPRVERDVATAAFRILQESLTNVTRHARATRVEVSLRRDAGHLVLRVQDNGCGIAPAALLTPLSVGLSGMRERALLLGGNLAIEGAPGQGTIVEMRLPLG